MKQLAPTQPRVVCVFLQRLRACSYFTFFLAGPLPFLSQCRSHGAIVGAQSRSNKLLGGGKKQKEANVCMIRRSPAAMLLRSPRVSGDDAKCVASGR